MGKSLYDKVWEAHEVERMPDGRSQLFIGVHLIHEVTSPQAFGMLKDRNLSVAYPGRTFATVDHIVPTHSQERPFLDPLAEEMIQALDENTVAHAIKYYGIGSGYQGIIHVVGPELGLTQPGTTVVCGDSHTATHGAFGAVAFGIGTSQVRDVLATQTLLLEKLKVRKIQLNGRLQPGVTAKDVALHVIGLLGAKGGQGFAYEYAGSVVEHMSMEERMTLCNMSIEGGARSGYCNPDAKTCAYLKDRKHSPKGLDFLKSQRHWLSWASDDDAIYADTVELDGNTIQPTVTWGVSPDQVVGVDGVIPASASDDVIDYMGLRKGARIKETKVDVAFIGSCTNGRLSDFESVAPLIRGQRVKAGVRALAVPGSEAVDRKAQETGIATIFKDAGFEWRKPGCSMCLAMNPDKLVGDELCASSSNRNFKGRQGSARGRTMLMSPLTVAASALRGHVSDPREVFGL